MLSRNNKSILFTLAAVLCWSTVATAFKLTLEGMNNSQLLFYSSLTSLIVLSIFSLWSSPKNLIVVFNKRQIKRNLLLGFINPFVYYLVLFKAYSLLPAQEAQPINLIWPLLISLFAVIFLKQKLTLRTVLGLLVSFLGVLIVASHGNIFSFRFTNLFGVLLALSSSFIWAVFWILNLLDKREETIKLFGSFLFGTIYTGIYIFFFDSFGPVESKFLLGAVYIGMFEMGITFLLWLKALALSYDKAKTSTIIYLFPVISLFFIALVLGERILISSIIGLAFILGGILIQHVTAKPVRNL